MALLSVHSRMLGCSPAAISSSHSEFNGAKFFLAPREVPAARRSTVVLSCMREVPKQFRLENLKEGLAQNYKSFPSSMHGLTQSEMGLLMTDDSPLYTEEPEVNEETISASYWYGKASGMWTARDMDYKSGVVSPMAMGGRYGGRGGRGRRPRTSPPDLPTILLDNRVVYIGMPIVRAVSELICAQLLFLDNYEPDKPIHFYINSNGALNDQRENIAFETDTYAIMDVMRAIRPKIFTINLSKAFGQAALLLALGEKGYRGCLPNATAKIYAPKVGQSGGAVADTYIKSIELEKNYEIYVENLAEGTGKTAAEIKQDISRPRYFIGEEGIEYGIIDRVIQKQSLKKRSYDKQMLGDKAPKPRRRGGRGGRAPGPETAGGTA